MTTRRTFLAGAAGIIAAVVPLGAATAAGNPDADLIALCAEHIANLEAYNRDGGMLPPGVPDPLWAHLARENARGWW